MRNSLAKLLIFLISLLFSACALNAAAADTAASPMLGFTAPARHNNVCWSSASIPI